MSFKDTLDALDARDAATALVEERFLESEREWKEILARRPMPPSSDTCLLYTSPSPRDRQKSRMPSSA